MITRFRSPLLAAVMAAFLAFLCASPATAAMVQSAASRAGSPVDGKDIETIQRALEHKLVQEKLKAFFPPRMRKIGKEEED